MHVNKKSSFLIFMQHVGVYEIMYQHLSVPRYVGKPGKLRVGHIPGISEGGTSLYTDLYNVV